MLTLDHSRLFSLDTKTDILYLLVLHTLVSFFCALLVHVQLHFLLCLSKKPTDIREKCLYKSICSRPPLRADREGNECCIIKLNIFFFYLNLIKVVLL